jgi:hypothetical protein
VTIAVKHHLVAFPALLAVFRALAVLELVVVKAVLPVALIVVQIGRLVDPLGSRIDSCRISFVIFLRMTFRHVSIRFSRSEAIISIRYVLLSASFGLCLHPGGSSMSCES